MSEYPKILVRPDGRAIPVRNAEEEQLVKKSFELQEKIKKRGKTRLYGESRLDWWRRVRRGQ